MLTFFTDVGVSVAPPLAVMQGTEAPITLYPPEVLAAYEAAAAAQAALAGAGQRNPSTGGAAGAGPGLAVPGANAAGRGPPGVEVNGAMLSAIGAAGEAAPKIKRALVICMEVGQSKAVRLLCNVFSLACLSPCDAR